MSKMKLLLFAAITLISGASLAGLYNPAPLEVDLDARFAHGDMLSTRNSEGEFAHIGCGTRIVERAYGEPFRFGFCRAEDLEGDSILCLTQNPALIDEIRAMNDSSFITFNWADDGYGGATCFRVGFSTQSLYLTEPENSSKPEQ